MHAPLLARTRELIAGCPCESGCPSCVGPEGNTGPHAKTGGARASSTRSTRRGGRLTWTSRRGCGRSSGGNPGSRPGRRSASSPTSPTAAATRRRSDLGRVSATARRTLSPRPRSARASSSTGATRPIAGTERSASATAIARMAMRSASSIRRCGRCAAGAAGSEAGGSARRFPRTVFIDLETTGLSGGAGTLAFLVGCGYFDLGAFQVRQFLLTSHAGERALLAAVADFFAGCDLIVTYNGKTFDVPVMETRWVFHRHADARWADVPHFDMLHPARRLWRSRARVRRRNRGGRLPPVNARADAVRRHAGRRRSRLRNPGALLQLPAQRRSASARAGARAQPPRSRVAGGRDGARACGWRATGTTPAATRPKRWRSAASTNGPVRSTGRNVATGGGRFGDRGGEGRGALQAWPAAAARAPVRRGGGGMAGDLSS